MLQTRKKRWVRYAGVWAGRAVESRDVRWPGIIQGWIPEERTGLMPDPVTRLNTALADRYRIERELGEGGMATVYLADDIKHERKVALKVLKPELAAVVGAERFLAEINTTANLQHPHILPVHDSGEADSFPFYVMSHLMRTSSLLARRAFRLLL